MVLRRRASRARAPLWNNVYNRWITNNFTFKWHRTTSRTSGLKSSIFNRNTSEERRLKFIASGEDNDNKKPRAKHRQHRLAQRRQRCQHSDEKYYNYVTNGADEEREHRLPTADCRWSQTSLPRKLILNLPILSGVRNFKWAFQVTLHFSSLVLLYSTPAFLLARVQPLSKLIQIFNFGIFIYWDVVQKREQKRPYLNHLGKTYNCFCNALISSHRILGVLAEERYHRSFTDSTLHTGVFTVNH